ncbi:hypothetical protein [Methanobacterium sp. SMA-27]|nr:hypothetical protein [Methanobacterium sp. SMA-27]
MKVFEVVYISKFIAKIHALYDEKKDLKNPPSYLKDIEELLKLEKLL